MSFVISRRCVEEPIIRHRERHSRFRERLISRGGGDDPRPSPLGQGQFSSLFFIDWNPRSTHPPYCPVRTSQREPPSFQTMQPVPSPWSSGQTSTPDHRMRHTPSPVASPLPRSGPSPFRTRTVRLSAEVRPPVTPRSIRAPRTHSRVRGIPPGRLKFCRHLPNGVLHLSLVETWRRETFEFAPLKGVSRRRTMILERGERRRQPEWSWLTSTAPSSSSVPSPLRR